MSGKGAGKGKSFSSKGQHGDNTTKSLPLSREELQRRRDQGLCLQFGKTGHRAFECPFKKSQGDRQVAPQRRFQAKGGKGKGRGLGKEQGKGGPRKGGRGPLREIDAHEYDDYDLFKKDEKLYGAGEDHEENDWEGDLSPQA